MKNTDAEIIAKIMEIVKLKKEILRLMVPEQTYKHLEVIGNEVKAILLESLCEDNQKPAEQPSVKKVEID
jgi:hypothetical protein